MGPAILRRASALTLFSFAWAAALNVLPQVYLLRYHPENKSFLLSAVLFAGTAASILGVGLSRPQLGSKPSLPVALACIALFLGVALEVRPLPIYVLAYVLFRFASNWLFNQLDHALVDAAGARAEAHATATTGFTILGQLAGPVVLVAPGNHPLVVLGVIAALGGWGMFAVRDLAPTASGARKAPGGEGKALDVTRSRSAMAYLAHSLLMLTAVAGFFSQLVFLLRDYVAAENAGRQGSLLMLGIGVVSIVTVLISSRRGGGLSRGAFVVPPALGALAVAILALKPGLSGLLLIAVLGGISGGQFLLSTRRCAALWEGPPGRAAMLSLYNNLSNGSALVAYALTGAVSLSLGEASALYHLALLALLFTLFSAAAIVCALFPFARSSETP